MRSDVQNESYARGGHSRPAREKKAIQKRVILIKSLRYIDIVTTTVVHLVGQSVRQLFC